MSTELKTFVGVFGGFVTGIALVCAGIGVPGWLIVSGSVASLCAVLMVAKWSGLK